MNQERIDKFAQENGFLRGSYLGKWHEYECYEPIASNEGFSYLGLPLMILEDADGNLRMSSHEEAFQRIDEINALENLNVNDHQEKNEQEQHFNSEHPATSEDE